MSMGMRQQGKAMSRGKTQQTLENLMLLVILPILSLELPL